MHRAGCGPTPGPPPEPVSRRPGRPARTALPAILLLALLGGAALVVATGSRPPPALGPWQELSPLLQPRRALAAAATATHLYAVGGMDAAGRYVAEVEYAPILPDGRLGPWRRTSALREPRFYLGAAVLSDYLYAVGGATGPRGGGNLPSAAVERARIRPDGTLGPWERAGWLTRPRRGLQLLAWGDRLYAIGGYDGRFLRSVESARLRPDGTLGPWRELPGGLASRYIHAAAAAGGHLYLLGGHRRDGMRLAEPSVESAPLGELGPGPWRLLPAPAEPRLLAVAFALGGRLYLAGGHDGRRRLARVDQAVIRPDGTLGPWTAGPPLRHPRAAAAAATAGRWAYVLGGMGPEGPLASVEGAPLNGPWTAPPVSPRVPPGFASGG